MSYLNPKVQGAAQAFKTDPLWKPAWEFAGRGTSGGQVRDLANHYVEIREHVSGVYLHLGVYMLPFIR